MNTQFPGFAVTGDAHLRRCTWTHRPTLANDAYISFSFIVDYCIANGLDLFSTGDLLDAANPPSDAIAFLYSEFLRLEAAGRTFRLIDGNHDASDPSWALAVNRPNVVYADRLKFELPGGIIAYGLNYRPSAELEIELAAIPKDVTVLFLHQMTKWAFEKEGVWNLDPDKIPAHVRMVFIGDYHRAVAFNRADGQHQVYTGSIAMQSTDEEVDKSFIHVQVTPQGITYTRVPIPTRRMVTASLSSDEEVDQFVRDVATALDPAQFAYLPEDIRRPMLVVKLLGGLDASRIKQAVGDLAHLWIAPFGHVVMASQPSETEAAEIDPLEEIISPAASENLKPFVRDLLGSNGDPRSVIEKWAAVVLNPQTAASGAT